MHRRVPNLVNRFIWLPVILLTSAVLLAGYAGPIHPMGDSIAILRLAAAVMLLLATLAWREPTAPICALALLAALVLAHTAYLRSPWPATDGTTTLYQKNLFYRSVDTDALQEDIAALDPDIITLQEVSENKRAFMESLSHTYQTLFVCAPKDRLRGTAVATHWPERPGTRQCSLNGKLAIIQVDGPAGPLWIASLHLAWPWPYSQAINTHYARTFLSSLEGPVVLAGDFNMLPWGRSVTSLAQTISAKRAGLLSPTFWINDKIPVQIDHVFAPGGGSAETRPKLGSDHLGVFAKLDIAEKR